MRAVGSGKPGKKPRAVAALAVLLGLLLNVAGPSAAQAARDSRAALSNSEMGRHAAGPRLATRSDDDGADREDLPAVLPPQPRIVTTLLSVRPAASFASEALSAPPIPRAHPYRARAPPAA